MFEIQIHNNSSTCAIQRPCKPDVFSCRFVPTSCSWNSVHSVRQSVFFHKSIDKFLSLFLYLVQKWLKSSFICISESQEASCWGCNTNSTFLKLKMSDVLKTWLISSLRKFLSGMGLSVLTEMSVSDNTLKCRCLMERWRFFSMWEPRPIWKIGVLLSSGILKIRWDHRLMMWSSMSSTPGLRSLVIIVLREILVEHAYTCKYKKLVKPDELQDSFMRTFF